MSTNSNSQERPRLSFLRGFVINMWHCQYWCQVLLYYFIPNEYSVGAPKFLLFLESVICRWIVLAVRSIFTNPSCHHPHTPSSPVKRNFYIFHNRTCFVVSQFLCMCWSLQGMSLSHLSLSGQCYPFVKSWHKLQLFLETFLSIHGLNPRGLYTLLIVALITNIVNCSFFY